MLEVNDSEKRKLLHEETTSKIIGAAFEVHDQLGYGFLERVYQRALQVELLRCGATAEVEKRIQVQYKGVIVGDYDIDVLVDSCVAVEIKVAPQYDKRDEAQLLNEPKATGLKVGMLVISAERKSSTNASSSKSVFHPCSSVAE
jgi:GxxExxY protein